MEIISFTADEIYYSYSKNRRILDIYISINNVKLMVLKYAYSNRNGHSPKYTGWGKNEHANFI